MEFAQRRPTFLGRLAAYAAWIVIAAAVMLVVLPILLLIVVFAVCVSVYAAARGWLKRAKRPNGVLDGRRNVRVVMRDNAGA